MAARNFLPRCTAFFNRIPPIESSKIRNSNALHLGKKFLAAIFSLIFYQEFSFPNEFLIRFFLNADVYKGE